MLWVIEIQKYLLPYLSQENIFLLGQVDILKYTRPLMEFKCPHYIVGCVDLLITVYHIKIIQLYENFVYLQ